MNKFCKNCMHVRLTNIDNSYYPSEYMCYRPTKGVSPVTGTPYVKKALCLYERQISIDNSTCGPEGQFYAEDV